MMQRSLGTGVWVLSWLIQHRDQPISPTGSSVASKFSALLFWWSGLQSEKWATVKGLNIFFFRQNLQSAIANSKLLWICTENIIQISFKSLVVYVEFDGWCIGVVLLCELRQEYIPLVGQMSLQCWAGFVNWTHIWSSNPHWTENLLRLRCKT